MVDYIQIHVGDGYQFYFFNSCITSEAILSKLFFLRWILLKVITRREVITAFLLMVTTTYVIRELDLLLCINVFGKASLAVTVRASMPSADTFVGFNTENINWFVIYWYLVCFSILFIWRGTNWGQNLYKNNTKKRKHNFLELSNSQNRMLIKRKRKNSLHSYHNLIPSSINSNPDSRCIECRLLEKRNYRFSLVSCIFKKVLNQTLYNFIMTDIG